MVLFCYTKAGGNNNEYEISRRERNLMDIARGYSTCDKDGD